MPSLNGPCFSIHQDLWHDCWVAATTVLRGRKKQVDFNIAQRVERLLEEYGPESSMPLTLRVYGTMIKGFCVINNERAKSLHVDCERLVFAFSQKPFGDEGQCMRLPPTKRKHADALTLDLDLAKVQESEAFDWTQAPLEEGALLQLLPQPDMFMPTSLDASTTFLTQADMLEVSFPALDVTAPMPDPSMTVIEIDNPMTVDLEAPNALDANLNGQFLPGGPVEEVPQDACMPPPDGGAPEFQAPQLAPDLLKALEVMTVRPRKMARINEPGRVFGFDEEGLVPADVWENWRQDDSAITRALMRPASQVQFMSDPQPDHSGRLRMLFEYASDIAQSAGVAHFRQGIPTGLGHDQLGDAREAIGRDEFAAPADLAMQGGEMWMDHRMEDADNMPPRGDADLAFLAAPPSPDAQRRGGVEHYDNQTKQVGQVIKRCLSSSPSGASLDDLLPPGSTDRATAARTFHALLALASGGEFSVGQVAPYMPISIAVVA